MTPGFLADLDLRPVQQDGPFETVGLALGQGNTALEVLVVEAKRSPTKTDLQRAWNLRRAGRTTPVLLAALHDADKVSLCGPKGEDPPVHQALDAAQAEGLCRLALSEPDHHAAVRLLNDLLPSLDSDLPGITNEGLFATHELEKGAPKLATWSAAGDRARGVLGKTDQPLLEGLGFTVEPHDNLTSILRAGPRKRALAVLLQPGETPDQELDRFNRMSPISYALSKADEDNLPWVMVLQGPRLRLYPVRQDVGVGRRGRTETFVEVHTSLLGNDRAALLWLLFSADALTEGGSVDALLKESERFAAELAEGLRDRIYQGVIPGLAEALARARDLDDPDAADLERTYSMAMTLLFRLLFLAYAEDKDLLPYRTNEAYAHRSLTGKASELADLKRSGNAFDASASHWSECFDLFRAIERGHSEWGVPAYGGTLFSADPAISEDGALLEQVELPNPVFGPILQHLLLADVGYGLAPVDFRSLGVREFGTVYEGLLESELSVAETDLAAAKDGKLHPAAETEDVAVSKNHIYLHNRSGERKATGSYFTPKFAVDHLLDEALEPALDDHLARLDALDDDQAGEAFFDFRVADIACGSGHFLTAAVDRIERRLANYLHDRRLPVVQKELAGLRNAAIGHLGDLARESDIEDGPLLRRLIARRCVYGVDLNPIAVELARLAVWIHTFVPGLPFSLLEHNLVQGNSLVGIGTLTEIEEQLDKELPMFRIDAREFLSEAMRPLERLANAADADIDEVERARQAHADARQAVAPEAALCDIVAAARLEQEVVKLDLEKWDEIRDDLPDSTKHREAREALGDTPPFHFPIAFPEVFLRQRAGFDVILGNPPWEKTQVEEHEFWARYNPGLRGRTISQREREQLVADFKAARPDLAARLATEVTDNEVLRRTLTTGPYPGMNESHPDLYKAFAWRFWHLAAADGGRIGVVLPRVALAGKGGAQFRQELFQAAAAIGLTTLTNNKRWVFPDVHPQWTIALTTITKATEATDPKLSLRGPFADEASFKTGRDLKPATFPVAEVLTWTDTASLPLLPNEASLEVFAGLRRHPRLDLDDGKSWRARPVQGDLNATTDKPHFDLHSEDRPEHFWPVYKGASFDLWTPDSGMYYAWADPDVVLPVLQQKRKNSAHNKRGIFQGFDLDWVRDPDTLPCLGPRIAFRDVARATDTRTVRCALVPRKVVCVHKAPYLVWQRGSAADEAYLLGILSSLPLDWYSRRFVETSMAFYLLNAFPVPRPEEDAALRHRVIQLAGRLACPDDRYAEWAEEVGVSCGPLEDDEKQDMIHQLDATVAHLYGLTEPQLVHIFETFHEGWDYQDRLDATLRHYNAMRRKGDDG